MTGHSTLYGRLQSPMPVPIYRDRAKIVLDVVFSYACGDFVPAALASNFSLGLITKLFGQAFN
jgi:hypothetical protein